LQGQLEDANSKKAELLSQRAELDSQLAEVDNTSTQLHTDIAKAKANILALAEQLAEELRGTPGGGAPAPAAKDEAAFKPGTILWDTTSCIVNFASDEKVHAALCTAGMSQEQFDMLEHTVRTLNQAAAVAANQAAPEGQRPAAPAAPSPATVAAGTGAKQTAEAAEEEEVEEMLLDDDQAAHLAAQIEEPRSEGEEEIDYQARLQARTTKLKGRMVSVTGKGFYGQEGQDQEVGQEPPPC